MPLTTVSAVLGHSCAAVTASVYSHGAPDASREALLRLGDTMES